MFTVFRKINDVPVCAMIDSVAEMRLAFDNPIHGIMVFNDKDDSVLVDLRGSNAIYWLFENMDLPTRLDRMTKSADEAIRFLVG